MSTRLITALAAILVCASTALAGATLISSDDFQDGSADDWGAAGTGDVRISEYEGNRSLRVAGGGTAVRQFQTDGYAALTIAAAIAADQLDDGEVCAIAVAYDGAASATIVAEIGNGKDDPLTLHPVSAKLEGAPASLTLMLSAQASDGATCWFDNVTLTGTPASGSGNNTQDEAWDMAHFTPPADARPPDTPFAGTFEISFQADNADVLLDTFAISTSPAWLELPALNVDLADDNGRLIPAVRGPITSSNPNWEAIISPGKAWQADGSVHVSLPFALMERNANCVHYGVLRFSVTAGKIDGPARFLMASETCAYFQFDLQGTATVTARLAAFDASAVISADRRLRAAMLPVADARDAPLAPALAHPDDVPAASTSAFGLVMDGTRYQGACMTRRGAYPFCAEMPLPSYSIAKSLVAGLAMMRLEKLHPGASQSLISTYVPACDGPKWQGVTFAHALNMMTGNFNSSVYDEDEVSLGQTQFFLTEAHEAKIGISCNRFPRREEPGTVFAYHTSDTYLLGTAMQAFWREKHEPDADFFNDLLANGIFEELGLSPLIRLTRRTRDAEAQPFTGWGLVMTADDLARLVQFIQRRDAMLDADTLEAALNQNARAPEAGGPAFRYANGIWAWDAATTLSCQSPRFIPYMAGFGGNIAAMLPGNILYYYFSDGHIFRWGRVVAALHARTPLCE